MVGRKKYCLYCGKPFTKRFIEGRTRLFCGYCREPHYENPVPASCVVVIDSRDRLLLVKRSVPPLIGHWCLPGGFMEADEGPEGAALRELKEETGVSGKIDRLLDVTTSFSPQHASVLLVGYLVTSFIGALRAGDDASDVAYFPRDGLPDIAFESHKRFIRSYYASSPVLADLNTPAVKE